MHRKVSIFLRNDSDCEDVDLYNTRKRYTVIENLEFIFQRALKEYYDYSLFSTCIESSRYFLKNDQYYKAVEGLDIFEKLSWLYGCCVEGIQQLFTNFYLHRKILIFLRNNSDCKDVDLYNTRKRYTVIESLDLMRNISWLSSCFSKIKKPN